MKKGCRELIAEANAVVRAIGAEEAIRLKDDPNVVIVDLRDGTERLRHGFIPGALHVSRGFLEFAIDPESPGHNPAFSSGKRVVFHCASGGRSLLAAKTAHDMGLTDVCHIGGGFKAWVEAGGPVEGGETA